MSAFTVILPCEEWNFSDVPEDELRACLVWECARECSELILAEKASELTEMAQVERWDQSTQKHIKNPSSLREKANRQLSELNFDLETHLRRLFGCHEGYNSFYEMALRDARPWSAPWQAIDSESRRRAVLQYNDRGIFQPLRLSHVRELESLWSSNSIELVKARNRKQTPARNERIEMLGYEDVIPIEIASQEGDPKNTEMVTALTIDFELYTDTEILESFRVWLRKARCCTAPIRRGKKLNDDRAALDGIGMMRSLHHHSFSNSCFPEKLRNRGKRACYKGRQLALNRFHELLPFLTSEARPLSWPTATVSRASKCD